MPASHSNGLLSGIQQAELRRQGTTLSLAHCGSLDRDHIFYGLLSGSSNACQVRLRSRRPFVPGARNLLDNFAGLGIRASEWKNYKWNAEYCKNASKFPVYVPMTDARPVGMGLPRAAWVKLNRLRTGNGLFHSSMHAVVSESWIRCKKAGTPWWLGFKKRQNLSIRAPEATSIG